MVKRIGILCLAAVLLCAGCRPRKKEVWPVVCQITVTCEQQGALTLRVYNTEAKMRQILNCLRNLGQKSTPTIDPSHLAARTYSITLTHTDESQRLYQIKGDRYIRLCRDPWQQVDPERISDLHLLLQNLPADDGAETHRRDIPRHIEL
jgi:hypothetical protein